MNIPKNKKICYTCITGNYDQLNEVINPSNDIDYICFSDIPRISQSWKILPIPNDLKNLNKVKQQRIIKICPHRYLPQYDISVWVDGNIRIIGNLNNFINTYDLDQKSFYTRIHPTRNCIYKEAKACINLKRGNPSQINEQIEKYKKEGYPENIGMVETNIILRKHNDLKCKFIDNMWAIELLKHSHRDQLSFNYVCWKNHFYPGYLINEFNILKNLYFNIKNHN